MRQKQLQLLQQFTSFNRSPIGSTHTHTHRSCTQTGQEVLGQTTLLLSGFISIRKGHGSFRYLHVRP